MFRSGITSEWNIPQDIEYLQRFPTPKNGAAIFSNGVATRLKEYMTPKPTSDTTFQGFDMIRALEARR
jgi:hypothetical protein